MDTTADAMRVILPKLRSSFGFGCHFTSISDLLYIPFYKSSLVEILLYIYQLHAVWPVVAGVCKAFDFP